MQKFFGSRHVEEERLTKPSENLRGVGAKRLEALRLPKTTVHTSFIDKAG